MKEKRLLFLSIYFLISLGYFTYVGYFETYYGLGIYSVFATLILALVSSLIYRLFPKTTWRRAYMIFIVIVSVLSSVFIILHEIDQYKPTVKIIVPEGYVGEVYLFQTPHPTKVVHINNNGIGYLQKEGRVILKMKQGRKNITDALNRSNYEQFLWKTDTGQFIVPTTCFEINEKGEYPDSDFPWVYRDCMDSIRFDLLLKSRVIQTDTMVIYNSGL